MPDKTISMLGMSAVGLLVVYLFLVGATVYFVSQETRVSASMHAAESQISLLEKQYYDVVNQVNTMKPEALGLVTPHSVSYVEAAIRPALSSAQN